MAIKAKKISLKSWQILLFVLVFVVAGMVIVRFSFADQNNLAGNIQSEYLRLRQQRLQQKPPRPGQPPAKQPPVNLPASPAQTSTTPPIPQAQNTTPESATNVTNTTQAQTTPPAFKKQGSTVLSSSSKVITPEVVLPTLSKTAVFEAKLPSNIKGPLVGYYIDSKLVDYTDSAPYEGLIDTTQLTNGKHTLVAVVFDGGDIEEVRYNYDFISQNNPTTWDKFVNAITAPYRAVFR